MTDTVHLSESAATSPPQAYSACRCCVNCGADLALTPGDPVACRVCGGPCSCEGCRAESSGDAA